MPGRICKNCSAELADGIIFCTNCGKMVGSEDAPDQPAGGPLQGEPVAIQEEGEMIEPAAEREVTAADGPETEREAAPVTDPPTEQNGAQTPPPPEQTGTPQPAAGINSQGRPYTQAPPKGYAQPVAAQEPGKKEKQVSTWGFVGVFYLMMIPVVNLVMLLIWAFGGAKRRTLVRYARAWFLVILINLVLLSAFVIVLFIISGGEPFAQLREYMIDIRDLKPEFHNWFSGFFIR